MKRILCFAIVIILLGSGAALAAEESYKLCIDGVSITYAMTRTTVAVSLDTEEARDVAIKTPDKIVDGIFESYKTIYGQDPACSRKDLAKEIRGHALLYNHFNKIYQKLLRTGKQRQDYDEYLAAVKEYMNRAVVADCSLTDTPDADALYVYIFSDLFS